MHEFIPALALLIAGLTAIVARGAPPERFREYVAVNAPADVARKIAAAREAVNGERWDAAMDQLLPLIEARTPELVEVAPGRYVRAADWANSLIARWPAGGLARYRARVDSQAQRLFTAATSEFDDDALARLVERFPNSRIGDHILWRSGETHWSRSRIDLARRDWERLAAATPSKSGSLIPCPDSRVPRADLLARLVLCSIMERDFHRASEEFNAFREQFPNATGELAGNQGNLGVLLSTTLASAQQWPARPGDPPRDNPSSEPTRFGPLKWERELTSGSSISDGVNREVVAPATVAAEDRLFFATDHSTRALNLETGEAAWPIGRADDEGTIDQWNQFPSLAAPAFRRVLVAGDRLLTFRRDVPDSSSDRILPVDARLACLDLKSEGRLVWSQDLNGSLQRSGWLPAGPPVVVDGNVWLAVERTAPEAGIGIARLNLDDGETRDVIAVCSPLAAGGDSPSAWTPMWLQPGGGMMFLLTGYGAVAAVDRDEGAVRWIGTYPIQAPAKSVSPDDAPISAPVLHWRGALVAAPWGERSVLGWNADTGQSLWRRELNDGILQIAGMADGRLIVCGKHLWALDPTTGAVLWRFGFDDEDGAGRATVVQQNIIFCTRTELLLLAPATSNVLDRVSLADRYNMRGGPLCVSEGRLILSNPGRIAVIGFEE